MRMKRYQTGQTLIETVIGIFTLVMGVSSAVGLAAYALNSTSNISQQLVGTALAREGIEAVRNMRDTNWLQQANINTNCYNYESPSSNNAFCYQNWQTQLYDIDPAGGSESLRLDIATTAADSAQYWQITNPSSIAAADRYKLYFDTTASNGRLYSTDNTKPFSGFYREILITEQTTPSYYQASIGPRLRVHSRVWWSGNRCATADTYSSAAVSCRVEIVSYLTNWRNY